MATVSLSQQHVKQHFNSSFYIFAISITFITMEIIGIFINPKKIDTGSAGNVLYSSNAFLIPYQIMLLVRIFMILLPHTLSLVLFMLKTIILCKFRPQDCEVIDYHDRNEISRSSSDYGLSGKKRSKGGISGAGGGGIGVRSNEDEDWSSSPSASSPQPSRNHNSKIEQINKIKSNLRFLNSAQHHTNGNGGGDVDDPTAGYDVNDVSPARPSVESQMSTENSVVEASNASFISDHSSILEHLWNNSGNDVNDGAGTKSNRLASSSNPDDISASPLDEETAALSDSGNHRDLVRSDAASDRSSTRAGPSVNNAEINNNNSSGRRRNSLDSMDHHESVLHSVLLDDFIDNPVRVQPKTLDDMIQDFEKCVFKNL